MNDGGVRSTPATPTSTTPTGSTSSMPRELRRCLPRFRQFSLQPVMATPEEECIEDSSLSGSGTIYRRAPVLGPRVLRRAPGTAPAGTRSLASSLSSHSFASSLLAAHSSEGESSGGGCGSGSGAVSVSAVVGVASAVGASSTSAAELQQQLKQLAMQRRSRSASSTRCSSVSSFTLSRTVMVRPKPARQDSMDSTMEDGARSRPPGVLRQKSFASIASSTAAVTASCSGSYTSSRGSSREDSLSPIPPADSVGLDELLSETPCGSANPQGYPCKPLAFLYVSHVETAGDERFLCENAIGFIINLTGDKSVVRKQQLPATACNCGDGSEQQPARFHRGRQECLHINLEKPADVQTNLRAFRRIFQFIKCARGKVPKILAFCREGSCAVAAVYVLFVVKHHNMPLERAEREFASKCAAAVEIRPDLRRALEVWALHETPVDMEEGDGDVGDSERSGRRPRRLSLGSLLGRRAASSDRASKKIAWG